MKHRVPAVGGLLDGQEIHLRRLRDPFYVVDIRPTGNVAAVLSDAKQLGLYRQVYVLERSTEGDYRYRFDHEEDL